LLYDRGSEHAFPLKVEVQDFSSTDSAIPYHGVAVRQDPMIPNFRVFPSRRYAIVPTSVPTIECLLAWAQIDMETSKGHLVFRLVSSLTSFMREYCQCKPQLPMVRSPLWAIL
jgi:hypothetical protein